MLDFWVAVTDTTIPLIRPYVSLDFDDLFAIVSAITAILAVVWVRRTSSTNIAVDVNGLLKSIAELEAKIEELREAHVQDRAEIATLRLKLNEYETSLEQAKQEIARLTRHEKEMETTAKYRKGEITRLRNRISTLETDLSDARLRIDKLEEFIRLNTEFDPEHI